MKAFLKAFLCDLLCWHNWHFRYLTRDHEEPEYRNVQVICIRCGMVRETLLLNVSNEGDLKE